MINIPAREGRMQIAAAPEHAPGFVSRLRDGETGEDARRSEARAEVFGLAKGDRPLLGSGARTAGGNQEEAGRSSVPRGAAVDGRFAGSKRR
jgi:hypothetical protein